MFSFPRLLLATLFIFTPLRACATHIPRNHKQVARQQQNENPTVGGSPETGWESMPEIVDANAYPDWIIDGEAGAVMPLYQTANMNYGSIKRAVIVLAGKGRDSWSYWNTLNNALYLASSQNSSINRDEISIMAPCWWTEDDLAAGAAKSTQLIWGKTTWVSGHYNVGPPSVSEYSSYTVMDALVTHYMDRTIYPSLETVVIAGHSAGAQMVQRYAAFRNSTTNDERLHFWPANPGSLLWLTTDRPYPDATCDGVDDYKYGLSAKTPGYAQHDMNTIGRAGIASRYRGRTVNYAWGLADNGPGDTRCEAVTQGGTHLERGYRFTDMLGNMDGGYPASQTADWIEGVSHDNQGMMESTEGIYRLFQF